MSTEYVKLVDGRKQYTFTLSTTVATDADPIDFFGPCFFAKWGYAKVKLSNRIYKVPFGIDSYTSNTSTYYNTSGASFSHELTTTVNYTPYQAPLSLYATYKTIDGSLYYGSKSAKYMIYIGSRSKTTSYDKNYWQVCRGITKVTKYDASVGTITTSMLSSSPTVLGSSAYSAGSSSGTYYVAYAMTLPKADSDVIMNISVEYPKYTLKLKCATTPENLQYSLDYGATWTDLTEIETVLNDVEDISFRTTDANVSYLINGDTVTNSHTTMTIKVVPLDPQLFLPDEACDIIRQTLAQSLTFNHSWTCTLHTINS